MNRAVIGEHALARATAFLVLPQVGLSLRGGFFNCPSMVVLVASQSCAASESLLAVGVGAFVGSFPRVNATVSSK